MSTAIASQQRRSRRGNVVVVATSAEPSAQGNGVDDLRYNFTHTINQLDLPADEEWSVGLARISFYAASGTPVIISADVVQPSRVGSQIVNELYSIPETTTTGTQDVEALNIMFRPVASSTINSIQVKITDQQGNALPAAPPGAVDTYVTMFFQRGDTL